MGRLPVSNVSGIAAGDKVMVDWKSKNESEGVQEDRRTCTDRCIAFCEHVIGSVQINQDMQGNDM